MKMNKFVIALLALLWAACPVDANIKRVDRTSTPPALAKEEASIPSNFDLKPWLFETSQEPDKSDEGAFRLFCEYSHLSYDDPILYPGKPGAAHLHAFLGNTEANHASTYKSLRRSGKSTCSGGPINRSAYWMPAVIDPVTPFGAPKVRKPVRVTIYYKTDTRDVHQTRPLPRGLKFIEGFNHFDPKSPTSVPGHWKCDESNGSIATSPNKGHDKQPWLRNPDGTPTLDCPPGRYLVYVLGSARCWSGKSLDSMEITGPERGRAHLRHVTYDYGDGASCPKGFPYLIPHFDMLVAFEHGGVDDYTQWHFSSDRMDPNPKKWFANGQSGHMDWIGAWDDQKKDAWERLCVGVQVGVTGPTRDRSCNNGNFGDGTQSVEKGIIEMGGDPEDKRYMDIPPDPARAVDDPASGRGHGHGASAGHQHGASAARKPGAYVGMTRLASAPERNAPAWPWLLGVGAAGATVGGVAFGRRKVHKGGE